MISGIILSAGKSERMRGFLKPLLLIDGEKFIEVIIERMKEAGVNEIIVVLGANFEKVTSVVNFDVKVVYNENWEQGQISSLRKGIESIEDRSEGIIFTPVDHPLVKKETYRKLIKEWRKEKEKIVIPLYNGRKGHPTIFPRKFFNEILYKELKNGARDVIRNNIEEVKYVPVEDEGVVIDIDTPSDYEKFIKKRENEGHI